MVKQKFFCIHFWPVDNKYLKKKEKTGRKTSEKQVVDQYKDVQRFCPKKQKKT